MFWMTISNKYAVKREVFFITLICNEYGMHEHTSLLIIIYSQIP